MWAKRLNLNAKSSCTRSNHIVLREYIIFAICITVSSTIRRVLLTLIGCNSIDKQVKAASIIIPTRVGFYAISEPSVKKQVEKKTLAYLQHSFVYINVNSHINKTTCFNKHSQLQAIQYNEKWKY